jgi:hypothetical protein
VQPGSGAFSAANEAGKLTDYVQLSPSPPGATPAGGAIIYNDVDAGVVTLDPGKAWRRVYLPARPVAAPAGTAVAAVGDSVYKVGRTTGLSFGTVTSVSAVVGPVGYAPGECWFRNSITIDGVNGTMFSDHGDSGSAIIKQSTGQVVGLLYAGNGTDTFACPINLVLAAFSCSIA